MEHRAPQHYQPELTLFKPSLTTLVLRKPPSTYDTHPERRDPVARPPMAIQSTSSGTGTARQLTLAPHTLEWLHNDWSQPPSTQPSRPTSFHSNPTTRGASLRRGGETHVTPQHVSGAEASTICGAEGTAEAISNSTGRIKQRSNCQATCN